MRVEYPIWINVFYSWNKNTQHQHKKHTANKIEKEIKKNTSREGERERIKMKYAEIGPLWLTIQYSAGDMHFIPYHGLRNNINDWLIHTNVFYLKRWIAATMMWCVHSRSLPLTNFHCSSLAHAHTQTAHPFPVNQQSRAQFSHFIRQFCHQRTSAATPLAYSPLFSLSLSAAGFSPLALCLFLYIFGCMDDSYSHSLNS